MPGDGLVLPPIKARVELDDSALTRVGSTASRTGRQIESGLGPGHKAAESLRGGLIGLAAEFGISLPPEVTKAASSLANLLTSSGPVAANVTALRAGASDLAGELGIVVPPQASKAASALAGLSTSVAPIGGEVVALNAGTSALAGQLGNELPPQAGRGASAIKSLGATLGPVTGEVATLKVGASNLATELGTAIPPEATRAVSALGNLAATVAPIGADVAALSVGTRGLAADLGAGMPAQAEKSATALKGLASSGMAANAVVGLTSGAVVVVEEDLAKAGNTASGTGEKIQSALETSKKASEALKSGLEGVGKGGEAAAAGGEAAAGGLASLTGAAVAGVAALTALVVVGKSIEDSYVSIAEKVENFRRVTGASADDASREVQVFEELGVNAETASQAVYKLAKTVESTPGKLQALGVEIAKDNAGQVDLNQTLLNTADAYVRAGSALQKDTILQAAFGKSGREMIPILEQGAAGLKQLEAAVQLTFTDQDLERVKQMKIHTAELKSEWQQYLDQLGGPITEAQNNFADSVLASNYANEKYRKGVEDGTIARINDVHALGHLLEKYEQEYYANQKVKESLAASSQAMQDQAAAAQKLTSTLNASISAIEGEASAEQKLLNANIDTKESQDKITEAQIRARDANRQVAAAQAAYNQAVKDYGKNSEQAKAALDALTTAQINQRKAGDDVTKVQEDQFQAYLKAASAAQQLQIEQDKANDVTGVQAAKAETEKLIDTLQAEANALAPNSPLRARLQEYINQLKSQVPAEVSTKYLIEYEATFGLPRSVGEGPGGHGTQHFASGGRPPLNKISEVGEHGVEIFTPDKPDHPQLLIGTHGPQPFLPPEAGVITPHGQTPPDRAGGEQFPRVASLRASPAVQVAPIAQEALPAEIAGGKSDVDGAPADAAAAQRTRQEAASTPGQASPVPAAAVQSYKAAASLPTTSSAMLSLPAVARPASAALPAISRAIEPATLPQIRESVVSVAMGNLPARLSTEASGVSAVPTSRADTGALADPHVLDLLAELVSRTAAADPTPGLLRELIETVAAEPVGQTGLEAALNKVVQGGGQSRLRGFTGR